MSLIFCEGNKFWTSSSHSFLYFPAVSSWPLTSKYTLQHPVSKDSQSVFFPWCGKPSFTPTQNK
jgi:hypothetical protein